MKHGTAVVIGKFYPPHRGHKFLIDTACEQSREVTVIVCGKPTDTIPPDLRGAWIQEIHPKVRVMVIDDRYDENDSRIWAENTIGWLRGIPDVVFTSEDYGERYASFMGSKHVLVDKARIAVPVSGTAVRNDPFTNWGFIEPPIRGWFAKRVCILGAESTGTTTLARDLVAQLGTVWVEEYGRELSAQKLRSADSVWRSEDFVHVAKEQTRREDAAARIANRVLICDTNAFATTLWHRRYMGHDSSQVIELAKKVRCDLYLLTGDEIPFVQDGLRDGEHIRHEMHRWFEVALSAQEVPWRLLRGSPVQRLRAAMCAIVELFDGSKWKPVFTDPVLHAGQPG